jgi:hypothetical protein
VKKGNGFSLENSSSLKPLADLVKKLFQKLKIAGK